MTVTQHHHIAIAGGEGVDPNFDGTVQILGNDNDDDAIDTDAGSEGLLTYQRAHRYDHVTKMTRAGLVTEDGTSSPVRSARCKSPPPSSSSASLWENSRPHLSSLPSLERDFLTVWTGRPCRSFS